MSKNVSIFLLPLALVAAGVLAAPASATSGPHGPQYSLKVIEGETTLPESKPVSVTTVSVTPSAQIAVSIVHGGLTAHREVGNYGSASLYQVVPQVGDVVTLESPANTPIESIVYDGLPTIDPTVCAGSTSFSGTNSPGFTVKGSYVNYSLEHDRYGRVTGGVRESNFGAAQVTSLSGTVFGGGFLKPLELGETVAAAESLETPLTGERVFTYTSELDRPVGACPAPPPPYVPPAPPALLGSIAKFLKTTIHGFLRFGARDQVTINQPGTVTQDLYLTGGKLPAFAARSSSKHHKKKLPPALLLAHGSVTAKAAGTVTVLLKLTTKGRHRLKSTSKLSAVLITTLRSSTGAKLNLQRRSISLHR